MSLPNHTTDAARPSATPRRVAPAAHTARVLPKPSPSAAATVGTANAATTPSYALLHHEGLHGAKLDFLPAAELKGFTPSDDDAAGKPATAGVIFSTTLGNHRERVATFAQLLGAVCGAAWSAPTDADGCFVFAPGLKKQQRGADAVVSSMLHRRVLFDVDGVWYARTEEHRTALESYVESSPLTCDLLEVVEANCRRWARAVVETKGDWATRAGLKPPTPARHPYASAVVGPQPRMVGWQPEDPCKRDDAELRHAGYLASRVPFFSFALLRQEAQRREAEVDADLLAPTADAAASWTDMFAGQLSYEHMTLLPELLAGICGVGGSGYQAQTKFNHKQDARVYTGCVSFTMTARGAEVAQRLLHQRVLVDAHGVWYAETAAQRAALLSYTRELEHWRKHSDTKAKTVMGFPTSCVVVEAAKHARGAAMTTSTTTTTTTIC